MASLNLSNGSKSVNIPIQPGVNSSIDAKKLTVTRNSDGAVIGYIGLTTNSGQKTSPGIAIKQGTATYYAAKRWKITYSPGHGTAPATRYVPDGYALTANDLPSMSSADKAATTSANGWAWSSWNKSVGNTVSSDITITGSWTTKCLLRIKYKHDGTYSDHQVNSGTVVSNPSSYVSPVNQAATISTNGWKFSKWNSTPTVTGYTTIDATWTERVLIAYNTNGHGSKSNHEENKGYTITSKDVASLGNIGPSNSAWGWKWNGWSNAPAVGSVVNSGITITANNWTQTCILRVYYHYTGSTYRDSIVTYNSTQSSFGSVTEKAATSSANGTRFDSWQKSSITCTSHINKVEANWITTCYISYSTAYRTAPAAKTVDSGHKLVAADLPSLTSYDPGASGTSTKGHRFDGWNKSVGASITGPTVITATWTDTWAVYYNSNWTTHSATIVSVGSTYASANITASSSGRTFSGWCTDSGRKNKITTTNTIGSNITLYAKWTCSLTRIKPNGASTTTSSNEFTFDISTGASTIGSLSNTLTDAGTHSNCTFVGWYDTSTTGADITKSSYTAVNSNTQISSNKTITEMVSATLTYNALYRDVPASVTVYALGRTPSRSMTLPPLTSYADRTFEGWSTTSSVSYENPTTIVSKSHTISANETLYGIWSCMAMFEKLSYTNWNTKDYKYERFDSVKRYLYDAVGVYYGTPDTYMNDDSIISKGIASLYLNNKNIYAVTPGLYPATCNVSLNNYRISEDTIFYRTYTWNREWYVGGGSHSKLIETKTFNGTCLYNTETGHGIDKLDRSSMSSTNLKYFGRYTASAGRTGVFVCDYCNPRQGPGSVNNYVIGNSTIYIRSSGFESSTYTVKITSWSNGTIQIESLPPNCYVIVYGMEDEYDSDVHTLTSTGSWRYRYKCSSYEFYYPGGYTWGSSEGNIDTIAYNMDRSDSGRGSVTTTKVTKSFGSDINSSYTLYTRVNEVNGVY
jgi:uncharacterized repeat protein (TIGR02543 family)